MVSTALCKLQRGGVFMSCAQRVAALALAGFALACSTSQGSPQALSDGAGDDTSPLDASLLDTSLLTDGSGPADGVVVDIGPAKDVDISPPKDFAGSDVLCSCGDGVCDGSCGETLADCPADCKGCGNGICEPGEGPKSCSLDCCGACGDGKCKGYDCGESPQACVKDCGTACGNKVCDKGETPATCAEDCIWQACGNGVCEPGDGGPGKCPQDCGTACGDGLCESGEDFLTCPVDCGYCGDGFCVPDLQESSVTCQADCTLGECDPGLPTTATQCDDQNPCTIDQCAPAGVCRHPPAKGGPCDDGSACTTGDHCSYGTCQLSNVLECDDQNPCTADKCAPKSGCYHLPTIDACEDGNPCTTGDVCKGTACKPGPPLDCEDGNPCTLNACDLALGCTASDVIAPCTDGDLCTTGDVCVAGLCMGAGSLDCSDGNPCSNDGCLAESGCSHAAAIGPCEDGNACTQGDLCANGVCTAGSALACNDGEACTFDTCDASGGCVHKPATGACDDGNPCTVGDVCSSGACSGGASLVCADGNACTTEACDPASGCTSTVQDGGVCTDGNVCSVGDTCLGGACVAGSGAACDDGNPCTTDTCDAQTGCAHSANADTCDDNSACTSGDHCADTACVGTTVIDCADTDPCTNDTCNPSGGCGHTPNSGNACSDGNVCTGGDICVQGACSGTANGCDDGNECSDDACSGGTNCVHTPNAAACEDGDACTLADLCVAKVCKGGAPMVCDDGNACTESEFCQAGACNSGTAVACDDGNPCTTDACDKLSGCQYGDNGGSSCGGYGICGGGQCACPGGLAITGKHCPPILNGVQLSDATLTPAFDMAVHDYQTSVAVTNAQASLTVDAPPGVAVTLSVNGAPVTTLVVNQPVPVTLRLGPNSLKVTAIHGGITQVYTLSVTRLPTVQQAYMKASNTAAGDGFGLAPATQQTTVGNGQAIAIWADTLVIGASGEDSDAVGIDGADDNDNAVNSGAAYVYRRVSDNWVLEAYIKPSIAEAGARFGTSVALFADTLVVGSPSEGSSAASVAAGAPDGAGAVGSGAAYVFIRQNGQWSQRAMLKASNAEADDAFGQSVAVSGTTLVVGAPGEQGGAGGVNGNEADNTAKSAGAAYVFAEESGAWSQVAYLKASNPDADDLFGHAVAISGGTIVVGAPFESSKAGGVGGNQSNNGAAQSGAAYVFVSDANLWSQQAYLKAANSDAGDQFGAAVAASGETVVVGAPREDAGTSQGYDNSRPDAGATYVFQRTAQQWSQAVYLKAATPATDDQFGSAVAVDGNFLVVGAPGESGGTPGVNTAPGLPTQPNSGAVSLFVRQGAGWSLSAYLKPSTVDSDDAFGGAVAIHRNSIAGSASQEASKATGVGGDEADNSAIASGAAYVFGGDVCYSNLASECDDGNPCTVDTCDTAQSCQHVPATEGAPCAGSGMCGSMVCACPLGFLEWNGLCRPGILNLSVSAAPMSPLFQPPLHSYALQAPPPTQGFTVTASAPTGVTLSLAVNGGPAQALDSGVESGLVPAALGVTYVSVWAAAEGVSSRYDIAVGRPPAVQDAYVKASNTAPDDQLGSVIAADGDTVVFAAERESSCSTGVNGDQTNSGCAYAGAVYVYVRNGAIWEQQAYIKASNTQDSDGFGTSVALSGNTLVVGADGEDGGVAGVDGNQADNTRSASGAAYVFVRQDGQWTQQAYLKASNPGADDGFGRKVAISGDTIVIGAQMEDSAATGVGGNQADNTRAAAGAAYVFVRSGATWSQEAYLKASNTGGGDQFGSAIALDGDTLVVGASGEDSSATGVGGSQADNSASGSGAAYVFVRSGTVWSQQAYLKASNTDLYANFGSAAAIAGNTVAIAADLENSDATGVNGEVTSWTAWGAGAVYVFVRTDTAWSEQAYIKASNSETQDYFGASVALVGDVLLVGATGESSAVAGVGGDGAGNSAPDAGAAYVFTRVNDTWSQQSYLKAGNPDAGDLFGAAVALAGSWGFVGAPYESGSATGIGGDALDNGAIAAGAGYVFSIAGP